MMKLKFRTTAVLNCLRNTFISPFPFGVRNSLKEEMYNTMNSYYKYTSIPKPSFYKVNILILPINIEEKYLQYSICFASTCDYKPL